MKRYSGFIMLLLMVFASFATGIVKAQVSRDAEITLGDASRVDVPGIRDITLSPRRAACPTSALEADVVAIDHPMIFNRLGAQNVNWMMYALRHDIIDLGSKRTLDYSLEGEELFNKAKQNHASRGIALRPDLRPRPLVLRVVAGGYLKVRFTNFLHVKPGPHDHFSNEANPFHNPDPLTGIDHPLEHAPVGGEENLDDQVASRFVGFHPQGLELVRDSNDDSSYVGKNSNSLVKPGQTREYCFFAPDEGAYLVSSDGAVFGGEGTSGNSGVGLFGAVTVQPKGARFYRAQVTEEEMRLTTQGNGTTPSGHPIVNYEELYPNDCASDGIWCKEGKAGRPILNMVQSNRIVHGDINALIIGPNDDGSFDCTAYPLESKNQSACAEHTKSKQYPDKSSNLIRNPTLPTRLEPFREFVSIFHDENAATQAFPYFFEHPELKHTLHGVRDAFMINYGSGGIGAEIIANRLQAGPMQDCLDCAYEEFFLSSFAVGDAAMLVDKPTNLVISQCQPEYTLDPVKYADEFEKFCIQPEDQRATEAYYPHDPANVHHSYIGDFVKFRNLHSGKEQHIFHLHNHQWLFNPNDDNSNYIDAQGIGPGSGYTYEIAYGGSGNRNKTVGDAIFHCHFYPHFAQGMWYMWRNHDVFEAGTPLAVSETKTGFHEESFGLMHGRPAAKARALPDGEINAGTPIPAIVPLPGKGMAPMPEPVQVTAKTNGLGSKAQLVTPFSEATINPGYPFWIAGVTEHSSYQSSVGSRPTTPPLDMTSIPGVVDGWDGGLPRHALAGFSAGGEAESKLDRFTAEKHLKKAKPVYYPETGTGLEKLAMRFHAELKPGHSTHKVDMTGVVTPSHFMVNGAPPVPGAPFNEPCIDDKGDFLRTGKNGEFFGGTYGGYINVVSELPAGIEFGGDAPRVYKGANLQLDVVFNKIGYHYPQQRILTLWEDVGALLDKTRAPEPLVMRLNTFDCAMYAHTNLVPKDFYADDYQITTPTDVIGQHIHLPKWDLTSADGSANGWNYEDGTFSPGMVRERIYAINTWNEENPDKAVPTPDGSPLEPKVHPYFNGNTPSLEMHQLPGKFDEPSKEKTCLELWHMVGGNSHQFDIEHGMPGKCDWFGARTTLQRWFSDPLINKEGIHRGLGITFTHDHLGPSTHQQLGLYATMLTEPPGSEWRHNETGTLLYTREDGGPTSWQAVITGKGGTPIDVDKDTYDDSHREFFLQFGDFQHAYVKDEYYGVNEDGVGWPLDDPSSPNYAKPTPDSFRKAINPSFRKPAQPVFPDIIAYEPYCPGGKGVDGIPGSVYPNTDFSDSELYDASGRPKRPCAEAISADDIGMMVVNYRNEPIGARVYDPSTKNQTAGIQGDLAFAMQNMNRAWGDLNFSAGVSPYNDLTFNMFPIDPFTPIMRAYSGDLVRVKIQAGAHEHEHNGSINAMAWMQGGSGFGQAPHSGWRNAQNTGLSEQFTFSARITDYFANTDYLNDRMYSLDTSQDGMWNGVWGILRSKNILEPDDKLVTLPSNPIPTVLAPYQAIGSDNVCPANSKIRSYQVAAVLANRALVNSLGVTIPNTRNPDDVDSDPSKLRPDGGTLVYNPRATKISIEMEDENGLITTEEFGAGPLHDPTAILFVRNEDLDASGKIKPGRPVEPLVLRAAAGDCIKITLHNRLPKGRRNMPDLDGYTSVSGIIHHNESDLNGSVTSFNNNLLRPSNEIGLHPQLVHYNVQTYDGNNVGVNMRSTIKPGETMIYQWYAGVVEIPSSAQACLNYEGNAEERYRQLSLFAQLSKAQNGLPTRSPVNLMTSNVFQEIVFAILDPQYLETGVVNKEVTVLANRLVKAASQTDIFKTLSTLSDQVNTGSATATTTNLPRATATNNLGGINNEALFKLILNNGISNNLALLQSNADQAPLLDSQAYFDPLKNLGAFEEIQANIDKLEAIFNRILTSSGKIFLNYLSDLIALNTKYDMQLPILDEIDRNFLIELKRLIDGSKLDTSVLPRNIQKQIAQISDNLARQLALSVYFETADLHTGAYKWRAKFFEEFDPRLNENNIRLAKLSKACRYVPVEFGGTNLTPPDRIKQGQKAAIGALVIEPEKSFWFEAIDDDAIDRQNPGPGQINKRKTRATATVFYPADGNYRFFRDLVLMHQKGLNLRYADGLAAANLAAEKEGAGEDSKQTAPEDAHDSGHMAINYGTEPMWFRFGLPPDAPFGKEGLGGASSAWQAFSNNGCCDNKNPVTGGSTVISADDLSAINQREPYVPIMTAYAGQEMRIRTLMPTGVGRASTMELHGHGWARDPYLAEHTSGGFPVGGRPFDWGVASKCIGENALAMHLGGQESVSPQAHYDLVFPRAGGKHSIKGDFLWRDHAGFGITNGLWSLIRVEPIPILFPPASLNLRSSC